MYLYILFHYDEMIFQIISLFQQKIIQLEKLKAKYW